MKTKTKNQIEGLIASVEKIRYTDKDGNFHFAIPLIKARKLVYDACLIIDPHDRNL